MTTQANNKRNTIRNRRGGNLPRYIQIFFLIILVLFTNKPSQASIDDKVLITDNFVINFNIETNAYTFAIASRLEAYNSIIASFFETDFLERVNVYIYNKSEYISSSIDNNIYISTNENFFDTEKRVYEDLFFIYLERLMQGSESLSKINKNFIEALISFPKIEQRDLRLILNDLINISLISSINIENLDALPEAVQQEIYTVFIHHVISNYGKKIFIQSLKDTEYYNGFFKSLSNITGESINKISESFNLFLQNSGKDISHIKNTGKLLIDLIDKDDKFSDVSFSVIDENKENKVAILQKDKDKYRLVLKDRDEVKVTPLKVSETGSYFNNIVSIHSNLIAITEIVKTGSKIYLFDLLKNDFTDSIILPMLFIRDINPANNANLTNNEAFIFSAYCGLTSDIYTFNIKNREFKVITESGYNSHPVMIDKVYYISSLDKSAIIELDILTGVEKILFSTDLEISYLKSVNDKMLLYSINMNGCDTNYIYNLSSGDMQKVNKENCLKNNLQIFNKRIYYISLYKGVNRLFVEDY